MPFIHASLIELDKTLRDAGGGLMVRHGVPSHEIPALARECGVNAVFTNRDYEPSAKARDEDIGKKLASADVAFFTFKDQTIFHQDDVLTGAGKPYTVFTPYKRNWLASLTPDALKPYASEDHLVGFGAAAGWREARHSIAGIAWIQRCTRARVAGGNERRVSALR